MSFDGSISMLLSAFRETSGLPISHHLICISFFISTADSGAEVVAGSMMMQVMAGAMSNAAIYVIAMQSSSTGTRVWAVVSTLGCQAYIELVLHSL
jgi:hypothetical protein